MSGLKAMGLELFGEPACKLPSVACVLIPEGVDGEALRRMLLDMFDIEIAGSFGSLQGRIWRIGTMGFSCRRANVLRVLGGLEACLLRQGVALEAGSGVQTALDVYGAV